MSSFKYLVRLLAASKNNWPDIIANLQSYKKIWSRLDRILGQEGTDTNTLGCFYVAVDQAIHTTVRFRDVGGGPPHSVDLGGFHHRVAYHISGKMLWQLTMGT